jgi:hypothetical protein
MAFGVSGQAGSEWEKVATIIGRSLAFLCLQSTSAKDGTLLEKARFLSSLGLPFRDAAGMLGSTEESLKALERQAKKPKGATRVQQAKKKRKRGKR